MRDKLFFDTSVSISAVGRDDPRQATARQLISGGVISVQVLNEFVSVARRKLHMSWRVVNEALQAFMILCRDPHSNHDCYAPEGAADRGKLRLRYLR
ncbi:MAG TPA: PIN domain-containing protein [Candidatus Aquilonibacter sp.]|nr:PIN domain-containing protein [Candidatus Aquilonibacter sp.]